MKSLGETHCCADSALDEHRGASSYSQCAIGRIIGMMGVAIDFFNNAIPALEVAPCSQERNTSALPPQASAGPTAKFPPSQRTANDGTSEKRRRLDHATVPVRIHTHVSSLRRRASQTIWRLHSKTWIPSRPSTTARRTSTSLVRRKQSWWMRDGTAILTICRSSRAV